MVDRKRNPGLVLMVVALLTPAVILPFSSPQTTAASALQGQLKKVFPAATSFSSKQAGPPPHFIAYTGEGNSKTIAGYAFWTTELEPLERGYDGPIKMLVGMDTKGILTGVLVLNITNLTAIFPLSLRDSLRSSKARTSGIHSRSAPMSTRFPAQPLRSRAPRRQFETAHVALRERF
jgi:hypothetical protein